MFMGGLKGVNVLSYYAVNYLSIVRSTVICLHCFDQGCYSSLVAVATSNTAVLSGPTCLFKFQDILKTCVS